MISSDFRAEARRKLDGKWGKVAVITLAYMALFFVLGFVEGLFEEGSLIQSLISLAVAIIEVPLAFGLVISLFKVYNAENVKAFDFWSFGFKNFKKSWGISFRILLKLIVPVILLIVSIFLISFGMVGAMSSSILMADTSTTSGFAGASVIGMILYVASLVWMVVKSYYYNLAYVVAADNESLTSKEAVDTSRQLMEGKRGKLFCLQLSFIGWAILAAFTLGIGYLWLMPYIQFATFAFYYFVANKNTNAQAEEVVSNNETDSLN